MLTRLLGIFPAWAWIVGIGWGLTAAAAAGASWAYLGARDDIATLKEHQRTLSAAAAACSESVKAIEADAQRRGKMLQEALDAHARRLADQSRQVTQLLTAKPSHPGDPCKSADSLLRSELSQR